MSCKTKMKINIPDTIFFLEIRKKKKQNRHKGFDWAIHRIQMANKYIKICSKSPVIMRVTIIVKLILIALIK